MALDRDTTNKKTIIGRTASSGLFSGPIHNFKPLQTSKRSQGTIDDEKSALNKAISMALQEIAALSSKTDDEDSVAILEFQTAYLDDDALSEPAIALINEGHSADKAFKSIIDEMAGEYETAEDEYFAARASDIRDLGTRVLRCLSGQTDAITALPDGAVFLADDLTPTGFLCRDWQGHAILLRQGSPTAHVAMLARSRGIAMIVGLDDLQLADGVEVLIDAEKGTVVANPNDAARANFIDRQVAENEQQALEEKTRLKPAVTASGEPVAVHINIADPAELDDLDPDICDGIGLVRTELLFHAQSSLPDEEQQFATYAIILKWAANKSVTIRLLDAGGDKPIAGLTLDNEKNPFLGLRGIRLLLARPEILKVQLRALLRAAVFGNLQIMVPMVSVMAEMVEVRTALDEACMELASEGIEFGTFKLGMMVEVPSVVLTLDAFDVDFFSIGSNDLTQYIMAAGRDNAAVSYLADTGSPAVLTAIKMVVEAGRVASIPVSLCGDAGSDGQLLAMLLGQGLRSVSVPPHLIGRTKYAISNWRKAK